MTTTRIIVLLHLRPGKDKSDYEAWARSKDLPTVNALGSVSNFAVYEAVGQLACNRKPPYDYIEILDIVDMDRFGAEAASETMQRIATEFQEWAEPVFIVTRPIA